MAFSKMTSGFIIGFGVVWAFVTFRILFRRTSCLQKSNCTIEWEKKSISDIIFNYPSKVFKVKELVDEPNVLFLL